MWGGRAVGETEGTEKVWMREIWGWGKHKPEGRQGQYEVGIRKSREGGKGMRVIQG